MGLFRRRPKLPPADRPPLETDERVLAWAAAGTGEGDGVLVATNRGLWLPGRAQRLGWHEILKATWSGKELGVTPAEQVAERNGYLVVADLPVQTYPLVDPGDLPYQVRTRVTKSVAYTQHHPVPGGAGRIAARRVSGVDGLTWTVRFDPGTPVADEAVLTETDLLVAAARAATAPADL
ncbi:hypothetical protein E1091_06030 [Micromonospora fluostatini]|uniref:Uncharacterized protein n=1 Tax=Micromonospora fluostatini TaxID=1629071 RepID=A0ABY2DJ15_9ACTN|nr:hypothetical protein E1091_06030 [Micromonospora fluostatini]